MPFPALAYVGAVVFELGGGLALSIFTVLAAVFFHTNFADQAQMVMFLKNFTIIGGLLLIEAHGAGGLSIDNRRAG